MGWTIRDFLLMNAPQFHHKINEKDLLKGLQEYALLCPERTCAAVKSHTEKGEDGEKYFGKTEARCLSAFFYTFPKWSSPDKMG